MANEEGDANFSYYHEFCRLHLANVVLLSQMRELFNERNELTGRFGKLEKKAREIEEGERGDDDKKKRFRRTANEIERHYRCPVDTCQRSYGSEGSLNQHIKIKHNELYHELNLGEDSQEL
jgi:hypothetical protein